MDLVAVIPGEGGDTGQCDSDRRAWRSWDTCFVHPSILAPHLPGQLAFHAAGSSWGPTCAGHREHQHGEGMVPALEHHLGKEGS